ncbi:hypothetical protein A5721_11135 [Mycobacterium vulneris]|nr:hypothetical protein A5721_11135 [Mycolicibacterium vulneris]
MLISSLPVPHLWSTHIESYLLLLVSIGRPATTVELRRNQLWHMARSVSHPPEAVTKEHITTWFGQQRWARETRRSYRSAVRGFFAYLYEAGHIDHDPSAKLPTISQESPVPRPAPDAAWLWALEHARPRVEVMLRLAAEAGLRRAEVAQVHDDDLDTIGPRLLVHGKGARDRVIPISESLAGQIAAGPRGHTPGDRSTSGYLFPNHSGGHLAPITVGLLITDVLPEGWTMHTLRHRFATRAYRATRNLRAVQMLLGHASVATTQRYLAVDDDEIRAAMLGAAA